MESKKSQDAKFQLHIWSRLLEGRIALQKVVVAQREYEKERKIICDGHDLNNKPPVDDLTVKSISKLLTCLVKLRDTYREKSQFNLQSVPKSIDASDAPADGEFDVVITDEILNQKHDEYIGIRNEVIEKWCEKTKIGTIPKKGYTALELPTLQLITNALKDKDRLIRRTQLDRTSHLDDDYSVETFNDDDFYHHQLKEVISKEESSKWVELQRLKYKTKRKAETKATKGRKIKKDLIPKLVNFMAPTKPVDQLGKEPVPDQIRNELIKSLFGGSIIQQHQHQAPMLVDGDSD